MIKIEGQAKYIALDTETGGIGHDKALLSVYFMTLDRDFNFIDSLMLNVKPNDGIYNVTAEALNINKINLVDHDKYSLTYSAAGGLLRDYLIKHTDSDKTKLIPIGHNVSFDLDFLYSKLLNKTEAQKYLSYRILDTGVIAQFFKALGIMPESVTGSLGSLVKHFNILGPEASGGTFHTADMDTIMTVEVLKAMIDIIGAKVK